MKEAIKFIIFCLIGVGVFGLYIFINLDKPVPIEICKQGFYINRRFGEDIFYPSYEEAKKYAGENIITPREKCTNARLLKHLN